MRHDVFLQNDSGALSVIATDIVDAVIDDNRRDDVQFVQAHKALLLELMGDDAMPVRLVVDEPLEDEEEAQWLARASATLDVPGGQVLVMGGFDPDILASWRENPEVEPEADDRGIIVVDVPHGRIRVDVYAHVGSMNGRQVLVAADVPPGAAFRRDHPGRAFPIWLAQLLDRSGADDPGHELAWEDTNASLASGTLAIDLDGPPVIGFLVHISRADDVLATPEGGWHEPAAKARTPAVFPLGLPSAAPDPGIEDFRARLRGHDADGDPVSIATSFVSLIGDWSGDEPTPIGDHEMVDVPPHELYLLYWIAGLAADAPPRFEIVVTQAAGWKPPAATSTFAVEARGDGGWAIGPPDDLAGWALWWAARSASRSLVGLPEGAVVDVVVAPRDDEEDPDSLVGRMWFSGRIHEHLLQVGEAAPAIDDSEGFVDALSFVRELALGRTLVLRGEDEREAFDAAVALYVEDEGVVRRDGDAMSLAEPDERTLLLLASSVFRVRHASHWPVDPIEN